MSDKISVIIPIYNGEKYLVRCLDSLKNQTWQNMEFLLIDDGSKDGSAAICKQYATDDSRFQYQYKKNGGVSSARNLGLKLATGDYIGFCDCDDRMDDNYYYLLLTAAHMNGADIAISGMSVERENEVKSISQEGLCSVLSREEALTEMALGKISVSSCNKLYSAKCIETIRFREDIHVGEDGLFCTEVLMKTNVAVFCNDVVYHYIANDDSVMHTVFHPKMWDVITANTVALEVMNAMPTSVTNAQRTNLVRAVCYLLEKACTDHMLDKARYKSCVKILREQNTKPIINQLTVGGKCRFYIFKSGRFSLQLYCWICPMLYRIYRSHNR